MPIVCMPSDLLRQEDSLRKASQEMYGTLSVQKTHIAYRS